jgi:hypothetical protein
MKPLLLGILLLCVASPVFCEEEGKVFTNEDLRKYKKDYGATVYQAPSGRGINRRGSKEDAGRENASQKKRDYYCSYGTKYKRSMDEAEHALKRCQEKFYEKRKAARFLISEDRGDCDQKKSAFERARATFSDLADKARREDIPDGWLRCQFE